MSLDPKSSTLKRTCIVVLFSIAFAYIESAVVVYLRAIFYPDGFVFPIVDFHNITGFGPYLITEIGREAATLVLIFTASWLIANHWRHRLAYFLIIFAIWDIFYYVWLKVLLGWPASIMDWDILFLMPVIWAGPVLAPIITSLTMLCAAGFLLKDPPAKTSKTRILGFIGCAVMIIVCFCVAGLHATGPDYKSYFSWPIFLTLHAAIIVLLFRCARNTQRQA